jgi:4'-phosphopantetheinyl transferase
MVTAAELLQVGKEDLGITYNPYGKPTFRDFPEFNFNVSHSGDWVVAIFHDNPVGIDVQEKGEPDLELARHFFSSSEWRDLKACGEEGRTKLFFDLWTLKESYLKAIGAGLSLSLDSFSMRLSDSGVVGITPTGPVPYQFRRYSLDDRHALSACSASGNFPPRVDVLDQAAVLSRFL